MKEKRKGKYRRLTQEQFIEKCKENQKIDLDYSKLEYVTQHDKCEVLCIKHNLVYSQQAQSLMLGKIGCSECLREYKSKRASSHLSEFIEKLDAKFPEHGFDFSKAIYEKASVHIEVTCKEGHTFNAKPNNLMSGHGCPSCFNIRKGHLHNKGRESYILKFRAVHGDLYDYSTVSEFKNCKQKVIVTCPTHGEFSITPDNHVQGKGCPLCGGSGFQPQKSGTFYILKVTDDVIKFGVTNNIERRLKEIRRYSSFDIQPMYLFNFASGYTALDIENKVYRSKDITRKVVSKVDMKHGYVETTYLSNLSKILSIVYEHEDQLL